MIVHVKKRGTMNGVRLTTYPDKLEADLDVCYYKQVDGIGLGIEELEELRLGLTAVIADLRSRPKQGAQAEAVDPGV